MRAWLKIATIGVTLLLSNKVWAETITMPSTLTANTSNFVQLSESGVTPSISGFTATDLLATIVASSGTLIVTTTTGLEQACSKPVVVVTIRVPDEATMVANKSVAVNPLMLGVTPDSDN